MNATNIVRALVYLPASFLLLYPVLSTPVVADDFINPFYQVHLTEGSPVATARYGWDIGLHGVNFRILGHPVGALWNWLWIATSAQFDVSMTTLYALTKFIVFILCAMSVAQFWCVASRVYGRGIQYWDSLVMTSLALFGTLQIHGLWSNDPVASYPLAGYAAAALGFGVLSCAILAVKYQTWYSFVIGSAVALTAVLYYEMNLGAILGAGVILAGGCWVRRRNRRELVISLMGSAILTAPAALALLYGRLMTGERAANYGGTEVRLSGATRAFTLGSLSSLPGSAWELSERVIGGRVGVVYFVFGVTFLIVWLVRWWLKCSDPWKGVGTDDVLSRHQGRWVVVGAVVLFSAFAVAIQAVTTKVQDETPGVGYVYTYYAVTSCAVALGLVVGARALFSRPKFHALKFIVCSTAVMLLFMQSTVNWRVSKTMNDWVMPNRRLLNAFDADAGKEQRCQALADWTAGGWPEYYEFNMIVGLDKSYLHYFGQPFCAGFERTG